MAAALSRPAEDAAAAQLTVQPLPPAVDQRVFHVLALDGAFTMLLGGDHVRSRALIATTRTSPMITS